MTARTLFPPLLYAAVAVSTFASEPQTPSERAKSKSTKADTVDFVLVERDDLRLLFCTSKVLQERRARQVCIVDEIFSGPREVPIAPGDTVRDVLKKLGKERRRSQLRLVTENAIEQSPASVPAYRAEDFLSRRVSAGDILVLVAQA